MSSSHPDGPALSVTALRVRYGPVVALDGVDLSLAWGRVCALIGVNGSGKSTLFKSIMGLVLPDEGEVRVAGLPPAQARKASLMAYVPQAEAVDWAFPLAVRDVVMMGRYGRLGPARRPRSVDHGIVQDALERVGLADLDDRQIGQLSGGQRKRVFVARALAQGARVLLLDEPFAGVDVASAQTVRTVLRDLAGSGVSVVVSTHELTGLTGLADEAALLMRRVLAHGTVEHVAQPALLARAFGFDPLGLDRGTG